jgi:putative flippase GtrA
MKNDLRLRNYLFVGVINTAASYSVVIGLTYINFLAELSNFAGYVLGFFLSYFLNKKFTFRSTCPHKRVLPRYLISICIAYCLNLLTLIILFRLMKENVYISQIIAGGVYTLAGYFLSKNVFQVVNKNEQ